MRFSRPRITSRLRRPMSPSMQTTFWPREARATAIFATEVVLPTPPFPEATVTTLAIISPSCRGVPGLCSQVPSLDAGHFRLAAGLFLGRDGNFAGDAQLHGGQLQCTHDGGFIAMAAGMHDAAQAAPDDDAAAGDDL